MVLQIQTLWKLCTDEPQRCKDEKAQIAPQQCERVIKSHQKELLPVYLRAFHFSHTASAFLLVFVK